MVKRTLRPLAKGTLLKFVSGERLITEIKVAIQVKE